MITNWMYVAIDWTSPDSNRRELTAPAWSSAFHPSPGHSPPPVRRLPDLGATRKIPVLGLYLSPARPHRHPVPVFPELEHPRDTGPPPHRSLPGLHSCAHPARICRAQQGYRCRSGAVLSPVHPGPALLPGSAHADSPVPRGVEPAEAYSQPFIPRRIITPSGANQQQQQPSYPPSVDCTGTPASPLSPPPHLDRPGAKHPAPPAPLPSQSNGH